MLRSFLNYEVVGLRGACRLSPLAGLTMCDVFQISQEKMDFARVAVTRALAPFSSNEYAAVIDGDVSMNTAHTQLREELSIGEFVRGSDLDVVVILGRGLMPFAGKVDEALSREQCSCCAVGTNGWIIRSNLWKMFWNMRGYSIRRCIKVSILLKSHFLTGNIGLYAELMGVLRDTKWPGVLESISCQAILRRRILAEKAASTTAGDWDYEVYESFLGVSEQYPDLDDDGTWRMLKRRDGGSWKRIISRGVWPRRFHNRHRARSCCA
jgi:hypothetical protein